MTATPAHFRILLVDDNPAIHEDFRKILLVHSERDEKLEAAEAILFDQPSTVTNAAIFDADSAFQGQDALGRVEAALEEGRPYALAFVDVRMPPGWDGIETIARLWAVDPALQVVICTAYADYSWEKMAARLGATDSCVILKKPFDNIEVLQLAHAMTTKWLVTKQAKLQLSTLDAMVQERTRALQAANVELRRSNDRFATAFRASPVPLAIQRFEDHRFVDVNEAFATLTGFHREELIGQAPLDLALCIDCPWDSEGKVPPDAECYISTRAGELRRALISVERIMISDEPHQLLIVQDISERLRLESQLRQSQKMEAIGQLAAGIAHDFNNLLTIIQGHSSLHLSEEGLSEDLASSLGQIEQAAERAADLTRQLLAFSRRQIMLPRVLNLSELVQKLGVMLRRLIDEQIEVHYELPDFLPPVFVDPTSVEQIAMNLAVNARDAMPKGGRMQISTARVSVTAEDCLKNADAKPGDHLCLKVEDTGTGMDEATRSRIFEPFFTTKALNKGTGMGLATVYGLAKQHDGWVEVSTALGKGSIFKVYFPVTTRVAEAPTPPTPALRDSLHEHTILIVEDDDAVRALVREVLVHHRYRVFEASDARSALLVWQERSSEIELLLTDIVMPGLANGLELSRTLLADKPELKVIYTSGYSAELFLSDIALQNGVNYLPKPYLSSKLTTILQNALEPQNIGEY